MTFVGAERAIRIDGDEFGAAPFCFLHARPEMQIGGNRVAAPDDDQLGVLHVFGIGADARTDGVLVTHAASRSANRAIKQRSADLVEEPHRHRFTLHQAHGAGITVWQDGLRIACSDVFQSCGDGVQCFVPADALKLALALLADTLHRMQQAFLVISALGVTRYLRAQHARRGRMRRVATDFGGNAIPDRDEQGTGVRAVVRTGAADDKGIRAWRSWVGYEIHDNVETEGEWSSKTLTLS